jgi:hypothetical protein
VDEIQLGLGTQDLHRNRWTIAGLTVLFGGVIAAGWWLPERGMNHPNPNRGAWAIGVAAVWLFLLATMINQARGKTRLTPRGLRLESYVKRRTVPWADVIKFEERRRTTPRGGTHWDVRVHRTSGRPLTMPGLYTSGYQDRAFVDNLVKLYLYWDQVKEGSR